MRNTNTTTALKAYMEANHPYILITDTKYDETTRSTIITFHTTSESLISLQLKNDRETLLAPFNRISLDAVRKLGVKHQSEGPAFVVRVPLDKTKLGL